MSHAIELNESQIHTMNQIDGLVQERRNSTANALELRLLH